MNQTRIIQFSLTLLVLCAAVSFVWNDCIGNDAAAHYIPMAELFAEGKFAFAFDPMIPPLVPCLAGVVTTVLPITGFLGLKIVSAVFMCLGMIPMYHLSKRLVPKEQAAWACVLYAVCAQVIRFGITAQLTSAKFFLVLWLIERCISVYEKVTLRRVITMGVAMSLLALCRTEGIFYLVFVFAALVLSPFRIQASAGERFRRMPVAWSVLVGTCLVIWAPWLAFEYKTIGYPVLDSRQVAILDILGVPGSARAVSQAESTLDSLPEASCQEPAVNPYSQTLGVKLGETLDGLYMPYLPLVFIGFASLRRRKAFGYLEAWLVSAAFYGIAVIWLASMEGLPVLKRYVFASALLLMPYAVGGWVFILDWMKEKRGDQARGYVIVIAVIVAVVSVVDGEKQVIDSLRGKYHIGRECGRWIKSHAEELDPNVTPSDASLADLTHWTGRSLVVASAFPQTACWAQAQYLDVDRRTPKTMQQLMAFLVRYSADVLIVDKHVRSSTDSFDANHASLRFLDVPGIGPEVQVYQCLTH